MDYILAFEYIDRFVIAMMNVREWLAALPSCKLDQCQLTPSILAIDEESQQLTKIPDGILMANDTCLCSSEDSLDGHT